MNLIKEYKGEIILAVGLFLVPFIIPSFGVSTDVGTLVTATSTIFAVVAGFFIVDVTSNYLRLQTLIAEEDAALISIADDAQQVDGNNYVGVHEAIDAYMIAQLDLGTLDHFEQTQKQIDRLDASIHALLVQPEGSVIYDHILALEEKIISCRQEMTLAAKKTLSLLHWLTLIALAALVVITVLAIRDGYWFTNVVASSMMVGILAVLVLLRDIDNNSILENKLGYKNSTQVFHAISKPPYYPYFSAIKSRIPDKAGRLRVGEKTN
ncbi:MAG: hypothetical protein Q8P82_00245 [bacterium]|nr:hypothetical protein [bacterium]